jgi:hypothetical protein
MSNAAETTRRFKVYARHVDHHHARFLEEPSFEAAAVAYLEAFDLPVPIDGGGGFRVIVRDVGTGHEHCFKLDLDTGQASPCG